MQTETISTAGGFIRAQCTEARVCRDIADRQAMGIRKYGTTVEQNNLTPLQWQRHHYEELLDAAVYCRRIIDLMEKAEVAQGCLVAQASSGERSASV